MDQSGRQARLVGLYRNRFSGPEMASKQAVWRVLCRRVFQGLVPADGIVLDLAAGHCELVNNLRAGRRIAVDLNPDVKRWAADGVEALVTSSEDLEPVLDAEIDTVFASNFFEHLPSKDALLRTLAECHRVLRPGGTLVVLMPNIRYLAGRYWDYFDHHLPLTHLSLGEGLELAGFEVVRVVPRFLPYTVKGVRVGVRPWMVEAYLSCRPLWPVMGRQMLVVAHRRPG